MGQRYAGDATRIREYRSIKESIDAVCPGLFDDMESIVNRPVDEALRAAGYLLEGTCSSTNDLWVMVSWWKLWQIPKGWLDDNFRKIIEEHTRINLNDDYEYGNLGAAVCHFPQLREQLIPMGLEQENPEVVEIAHDDRKLLPGGSDNWYRFTMEHMRYLGLEKSCAGSTAG